MQNKVLVSYAEIDNMQKRHSKALSEAYKFASSPLVLSFANIYAEIGLAIDSAEKVEKDNAEKKSTGFDTLLTGVKLIHKKFTDELGRNNVLFINPSAGDEFKVSEHEAIGTDKIDEKSLSKENTISYVFSAGFRLHEKVIKPACVRVFKK